MNKRISALLLAGLLAASTLACAKDPSANADETKQQNNAGETTAAETTAARITPIFPKRTSKATPSMYSPRAPQTDTGNRAISQPILRTASRSMTQYFSATPQSKKNIISPSKTSELPLSTMHPPKLSRQFLQATMHTICSRSMPHR